MGASSFFRLALFLFFSVLSVAPAIAVESKEQAALRQGDYYKTRGEIGLAGKYYEMAVALAPQDPAAHRALAENLGSQKKYPQVLIQINMALALTSSDPKLYVDRGLCYVGLGKTKEAENDFRKAVASPSCGHAVYQYLADLYKSEGRLDDALALMDLHIKREANEDTYRDKASLLALKKDYAGARQALTKAIACAPYNYRNFELRADACMASGLAKEAVLDYSKALSLEPFFAADIYQNRARAYSQLGEKELAKKDMERSRTKD